MTTPVPNPVHRHSSALFRRLRLAFYGPLYSLHCLAFALCRNHSIIEADLRRWSQKIWGRDLRDRRETLAALILLLASFPEFRSLFYYRIGFLAGLRNLLRLVAPPMPNLYIHTPEIGPGLYFQHGFSTILSARRIGRDCHINHQVTLGYTNDTDCPIIGDNVTIFAGAIVIGNVHVGDNAVIGAGAVVVKDVPPDCTVAGVPARVIKDHLSSQ